MSQRKIHLSKIEDSTSSAKKARWGARKYFIALICVVLFFLSPLPELILSLVPHSVVRAVLSPVFQNVILDETPPTLSDPVKYQHTENLPVLGRDSGVCFLFNTMESDQNNAAKRGRIIAEIIAVATDKKEYILDEVTFNTLNKEKTVAICQEISYQHSLLPNEITTIYIRPLSPFSPTKIIWASKKEIK